MSVKSWNESLPLYLDHTVLRPEATKADVLRLCAEAREQGFVVIFVPPCYVDEAVAAVAGTDVQVGIPGFEDEQKRVLAATIENTRVVCVYIPNGQSLDSDKYPYKLRWLDALIAWLKDELTRYPRLALLGDYNIAPEDADVHDPAAWAGNVLVSEPERARFKALAELGLKDAFRLFPQEEKSYSWWDYRQGAFRRNLGLRIDHILLSPELAAGCSACVIDKTPRRWERPSDHTPVIATVD